MCLFSDTTDDLICLETAFNAVLGVCLIIGIMTTYKRAGAEMLRLRDIARYCAVLWYGCMKCGFDVLCLKCFEHETFFLSSWVHAIITALVRQATSAP